MITHKRKHHVNWKRRLFYKLLQLGYNTFDFPNDKIVRFELWGFHNGCMAAGRFHNSSSHWGILTYKDELHTMEAARNVSKVLLG